MVVTGDGYWWHRSCPWERCRGVQQPRHSPAVCADGVSSGQPGQPPAPPSTLAEPSSLMHSTLVRLLGLRRRSDDAEEDQDDDDD